MHLVINTRGAYLRKEKNCFLVKNDEKVFEVSAEKVDSILITTAATISTDAIEFAVANNIEILFLDRFGDPYGRIWHCKLGSTTLIRRRQLELLWIPEGFDLVRGWVADKIGHQIGFVKDLRKNRPVYREPLQESLDRLDHLHAEMLALEGAVEALRGTIMGIEGASSATYFDALSMVLPEPWKFAGRSRDPAKDAFNCLLNYGYGMLYGQVERACIIAGLDPYVGILHTDNYNKMSFVFDLIEIFRVKVDRTIMGLFTRRQVNDGLFDRVPGGLTLNREGKAVLITAVNEAFDAPIEYRGRQVKFRNAVQLTCHAVANRMLEGATLS